MNTTTRFTLYVGLGTTPGLTPDEAEALALSVVEAHASGFTATRSTGGWEGTREPSLRVEVVGGKFDSYSANRLARALANGLKQTAVFITRDTVDAWEA